MPVAFPWRAGRVRRACATGVRYIFGMARSSLVVVFALLAAGCGKDPLTLEFDVDKSIPDQTIPGSLAPCQLPVSIPLLGGGLDMTITQEEDFPEQDTDVQHVKSARVRRLVLALTPASSEPSWDFLDALNLFVEAEGLERRLVASIGAESESEKPIPEGATELDLEPERLNLAPYLKASGGFTMTSEAIGCHPQQEVVFDGELRVHIVADPL